MAKHNATFAFPGLGKLKQEDVELKASLDYVARLFWGVGVRDRHWVETTGTK